MTIKANMKDVVIRKEETVPENEPYMIHPRNKRLITVADVADEFKVSRKFVLDTLRAVGFYKDNINSPITLVEYDVICDKVETDKPQEAVKKETVVNKTKEEDEMTVFESAEEMMLAVNMGVLSIGEPDVFYHGPELKPDVKVAEVKVETKDGEVYSSAYFSADRGALSWKHLDVNTRDYIELPKAAVEIMTSDVREKYRKLRNAAEERNIRRTVEEPAKEKAPETSAKSPEANSNQDVDLTVRVIDGTPMIIAVDGKKVEPVQLDRFFPSQDKSTRKPIENQVEKPNHGLKSCDVEIVKRGNLVTGDVVARAKLTALGGKTATFVAVYSKQGLEFKELGGSGSIKREATREFVLGEIRAAYRRVS